MHTLEDRIAIITGAGRGIGRSIALAFAREGAHCALCDLLAREVKQIVKDVSLLGRSALAIQCDVSEAADVEALVTRTLTELGRIDILVNNAGIQIRSPLANMPIEDWDRTIAVNLRGPFLCTRAVLPHMINQGYGKIINISSDSGKRGWATGGAYCASKFGLLGLTESVALEVSKMGINVNAICPGGVVTPMSQEVLTPEGKHFDTTGWMQPEDIADVAVFLASDASRGMFGSAVDVFGKER